MDDFAGFDGELTSLSQLARIDPGELQPGESRLSRLAGVVSFSASDRVAHRQVGAMREQTRRFAEGPDDTVLATVPSAVECVVPNVRFSTVAHVPASPKPKKQTEGNSEPRAAEGPDGIVEGDGKTAVEKIRKEYSGSLALFRGHDGVKVRLSVSLQRRRIVVQLFHGDNAKFQTTFAATADASTVGKHMEGMRKLQTWYLEKGQYMPKEQVKEVGFIKRNEFIGES